MIEKILADDHAVGVPPCWGVGGGWRSCTAVGVPGQENMFAILDKQWKLINGLAGKEACRHELLT